MDAAHSPLGPSAAERWIPCPGSVALTRDVPDTDKSYSIEGTAAHTVLEIMRRGQLAYRDPDAPVFVKLVDGTMHPVAITEDMLSSAQYMIDHLAELPGFEFNEQKVSYANVIKGAFGTLDAAKATEDTLYLRDYKYGLGVIKYAAWNPQLMLCALGFLETYGYLFNITKLNLGIVQPRSDHVDVWECTVDTMHQWVRDVAVPAALATEQPDAPVVPGDHCQFCKIKTTCAVRAQAAVANVIGDFENVVDLRELKLPSQHLTVEQMDAALKAAPLLEAWLKDLKAGAMNRLKAKQPVGDWKIVEGTSRRHWANGDPRVVADRLGSFGVDPWTEELVSVAVAEKQIGKKKFAASMAEFVVKPPGKPVLAPGSDRRPSMEVTTVADFEEVPDDQVL